MLLLSPVCATTSWLSRIGTHACTYCTAARISMCYFGGVIDALQVIPTYTSIHADAHICALCTTYPLLCLLPIHVNQGSQVRSYIYSACVIRRVDRGQSQITGCTYLLLIAAARCSHKRYHHGWYMNVYTRCCWCTRIVASSAMCSDGTVHAS